MLVASPEMPKLAAVSAAPTVPECSTERPVFVPGFTPLTTTWGSGPKAPRRAAMTASAGGPSTLNAGVASMPGSSTGATSMPAPACRGPMPAPLPL